MTDFSDFEEAGKPEGPVRKGPTKRAAPKSALERLAEAATSPLGMSALERLGAVSPMERAMDALGGTHAASALARQFQELEDSQKRLRDAFGHSSIDKMLDDRSSLDAASRLKEAARGAMIPKSVFDDRISSARLPELPPNPILETNEHLEQVGEKIGALLDVQAKQASLIDSLLQSQIASGKVQTRIAILGLLIGLAGVLVAVLALV